MTDTQQLLQTARRLQGSGCAREAFDLLDAAIRDGAADLRIHSLRARLLGQTSSPHDAEQTLEQLVQSHPANLDLLLDLLSFHIDGGNAARALQIAQEGLSRFPEHPHLTCVVVDALDLLNQPEAAEETARKALTSHPEHSGLKERLHRLTEAAARQKRLRETLREAEHDRRTQQRRIPTDPDFLARFLDEFSGREGVHALQFQNRGGDWGYRPVHTSLTEEKLKRHLAGDETLGLYLVRHDNTSRVMVFDLDITKPFLARYLRDPLERRRLNQLLEQEGRRLLNLAAEIELPLLVEHSGFKGLHFWAVSEAPIPARQWRAVGQWILDRLDRVPRELAWELFPKQDTVPEDGIGNLVKLPFGVHRKTQKRSWLLDAATLQVADDQQACYQGHQRLSASHFSEILGRLTLSHLEEEARREAIDRAARKVEIEKSETVAPSSSSTDTARTHALTSPAVTSPLDLAIRIPYPSRFPESVEKVFAGCRVTWALVEQVLSGKPLDPKMRHVLTYVLTAIGEEGQVALHQILNQAPGYDPNQVNRAIRAVCPQPISCSKVRHLLPNLAAKLGCSCQFRLPEGSYPSPIVHAGVLPTSENGIYGGLLPPPPLAEGEDLYGVSGGIDNLMREYQSVVAEIGRLKRRQGILHQRISSIFDTAGAETVTTAIAEYRRLPPLDAESDSRSEPESEPEKEP